MGKRALEHDDEMYDDRSAYRMCHRKRKYKSGKASRSASRFGQRKYQCPICGHWHLTKRVGDRGR